jgi:hypothetical protein
MKISDWNCKERNSFLVHESVFFIRLTSDNTEIYNLHYQYNLHLCCLGITQWVKQHSNPHSRQHAARLGVVTDLIVKLEELSIGKQSPAFKKSLVTPCSRSIQFGSFETSVTIHQSSRRHVPLDLNVQVESQIIRSSRHKVISTLWLLWSSGSCYVVTFSRITVTPSSRLTSISTSNVAYGVPHKDNYKNIGYNKLTYR